jgi:hypothetical protein
MHALTRGGLTWIWISGSLGSAEKNPVAADMIVCPLICSSLQRDTPLVLQEENDLYLGIWLVFRPLLSVATVLNRVQVHKLTDEYNLLPVSQQLQGAIKIME